MEELLQAVTSLKKDFQERKISRLKQDQASTYEYRLSLLSPKLSSSQYIETKPSQVKTVPRVPLIRIPKPQDEFSRYLQGTPHSASLTKSSPSRQRSYKLDAASLLMSRVKKFVAKHFRLWRKNAEQLRSVESKMFKSRDLVFKVNISQKPEKLRYHKEKQSEDEVVPKSLTNRLSPHSPLGLGISPKHSASKQLFIDTSVCELEVNTKTLNRPASARGEVKVRPRNRAWSDNRLKQGANSKNQICLINQFVNILAKWKGFQIVLTFNDLKRFPGFKESDGIERVHQSKGLQTGKNFTKGQELQEKSAKSRKNCGGVEKSNIEAGVSVLNNIYLNHVSEQFFFMKFRCVVESGFFEESGIVESSQDNLKEYIESIEKNRKKEKSYSHKSISYLVNAPSFLNLMVEVESTVLKKHFKVFFTRLKRIQAFFKVSGIFYRKFSEFFKEFKENDSKETKNPRKLRLLLKAFNKSRVFLIETCFSHWKTFPSPVFSLPLELLTLITAFESIQKSRKRDFFQSVRLCKYKKFLQKPSRPQTLKKGLILLSRHVSFIKKRVFLKLSHAKRKSFSMPARISSIQFILFQLKHKVRNSFRTWKFSCRSSRCQKSGLLFSLSQLMSSKLHPFYLEWKQLIINN